jgi:hypothetical protein
MGNIINDEKNRCVKFKSILTTRRVVYIVEVGFLLMGNTHEDMDESYGTIFIN